MGVKERNLQRQLIRAIEEQTDEYIRMRKNIEKMYEEWIKLIKDEEKKKKD